MCILTLLAAVALLCACKTVVYTLTYVADGKVIGQQKYNSQNINIFVPQVPEKDGYTGEWEEFTLRPKDLTVNAVYTPIEYTVTFKANGETAAAFPYTVENKDISVPPVPERTGYEGKWENFELTFGDKTVNAVYTPKRYTAVLFYNGAFSGDEQKTVTFDYGKEAGVLPQPIKEDAVFSGWFYGEREITPDTVWSFDEGSVTLDAKWTDASDLNYSLLSDGRSYSVQGLNNSLEQSIYIPPIHNGLPVTEIAEMAFNGLSSFNEVYLPSSIINIRRSAFFGCLLKKVTIPKGVKRIEEDAFAASAISTADISSDVEYIGDGAFTRCQNLYSIAVSEDNAFYYSPNKFYLIEKSTKKLVCGTGRAIPTNGRVTVIGDYALAYSNFTSLTVPSGVTDIGKGAFMNCSSLSRVSLPDSLRDIGDFAFYSSGLTRIFIPFIVDHIGKDALGLCRYLESITVASGNKKYHASGNCLIETESKTLVASASSGTVPSDGSVTIIGESAFSGFNYVMIYIPNGITRLERGAFANCPLNTFSVPSSVTYIGSTCFYGCYKLVTLTYHGTKAQWNDIEKESDWKYLSGIVGVECSDGYISF